MLMLLTSLAHGADDPRIWLEDVEGEQALTWVKERNAQSEQSLVDPAFEDLRTRLKSIFDSDERIPDVRRIGEHWYNFWQDAAHPRGIWRRTTWDSYTTASPVWETVIDVDALGAAEGEKWVWHGADCLEPSNDRCLVALSPGGSDADVKREFDLLTGTFVEGGFTLPEAKSDVSWIDRDHLFVMTDRGEGSLTDSGYPRTAVRWTRGTPLTAATQVFEGQVADVAAGASHDTHDKRSFAYRVPTFFTNELYELGKKGAVKIDKPDDTSASVRGRQIWFQPRKDWAHGGKTYKAGSLLVADYKRWKKGKGTLQTVYEPDEHSSLESWTFTKNFLVLSVLQDVKSRLLVGQEATGWALEPLKGAPTLGHLEFRAVDSDDSDQYFLDVADFLSPRTLMTGTLGVDAPRALKTITPQFDADGLTVEQHFATSKDGTKVPYFQIGRKDAPLDGSTPTILYGYGGFEVSLLPVYSGHIGAGWLERGGTYVIANIRGGGEYGPRWHQAALKDKRHRAYEDFAAVAEDLVARKVTSPEKLGTMGGSNGGLLMGNMYTLYPELFGAVVCQVPLLDMQRYTKLLAGASWAGEYGDPDDPEQWAFIKTFSPYHNIDATKEYPPILFTTSTRDDRVHPGHARKMAAALIEAGKPVEYYENIEGGHGGAADSQQQAHMRGLAYTFLWRELNRPKSATTPPE